MARNGGIRRREFLKWAALGALAPWPGLYARPTEPDVVIVGAGAAGLAAARKLAERGRSFLCLEAADRIGGRAHTDTSVFGVPYDRGAHWLHNGELNPFNAYARERGFEVYLPDSEFALYVGDRRATAAEERESQRSVDAVNSALERIGRDGRDVSVASVLPAVNDWDATTEFLLGPMSVGIQFEDYSSLDWWHFAEGKDWFCAEGFGAVVADYGRAVPVELGTAVERLDWSGTGVVVHTPAGTIRTRAVILTVSPGVLTGGAIAFEPALPEALQDAFGRLPMARYNHIALQFSENVLDAGPDDYIVRKTGSGETVGVLANISDTGLSLADVGGELAVALEGESDETAVDFALGELAQIFGSAVREKLIASDVTRWGQNPLTHGSWAQAEPGHFAAREALRERGAIADRIFLAGEALHPSLFSTVAGAALMGQHAAEQADRVLTGDCFEPMGAIQPMRPGGRTSQGPVGRLMARRGDSRGAGEASRVA